MLIRLPRMAPRNESEPAGCSTFFRRLAEDDANEVFLILENPGKNIVVYIAASGYEAYAFSPD
jgi:hypothetical protein